MLSKIREIRAGGKVIEKTPLLVPSFSSKGFWDIRQVYNEVQPLIDRPILVSAYDIFYEKIDRPDDPAGLIILDSGGYEASKDADLSDYGDYSPNPQEWNEELFAKVISSWDIPEPTVFVSYDHPDRRITFGEQITDALGALPGDQNSAREILLKPESEGQRFLDIGALLKHVESLAGFDLLGVTEKELGGNTAERMRNIAALRRGLDSIGCEIPIHIFGSLDTFNTVLYFLSGADVFDGLTWLRFSFFEGHTLYKHVHASRNYGLEISVDELDPACWFDNYQYLRQLERSMRKYTGSGEFSEFEWNAEELDRAYKHVVENKGGM